VQAVVGLEAHQVPVVEKPDRGAVMGLLVKLAGLVVEVEGVMVLPVHLVLFELSGPAVLVHSHQQTREIYK
jgi:hypothetical protein